MLSPGSTIGIFGGGQLGRMLAIAAAEMGYKTHIYCPEAGAPAFEVSTHATCAAYDDLAKVEAFAQSVDVITYEFENIPVEPVRHAAQFAPVRPGADTLAICQHRQKEKAFLSGLGIPVAKYIAPKDHGDLHDAQHALGLPYILKTAVMGYDGKGQRKFTSADEVTLERTKGIWKEFDGIPLVLEQMVDFSMEISVIVARSADGQIACYPPAHNVHRDHILHQTTVPAPIPVEMAKQAENLAYRIAEGLKLEGILAVEMFVGRDGALLVNELAPRPHNSGHWTIDACITSQFEQTVRAICGLPLGDVTVLCAAEMTNLIGDEINQWADWLKQPTAKLHLYGKTDARPGRKMGHVTVLKAE